MGRIRDRLDASIEREKGKNDFLTGVSAIVEAITARKIECKVYRKDKFHAKAYITRAPQEVIGAFALVGSSNFTHPGLTENVELNVQLAGRQVGALQEWYDKHWKDAEDVTVDILRVLERHVQERTPFKVYLRALQEFFRGHEMTADEWEKSESRMYGVLDQYQREGYHNLLKIAKVYGGALRCDGVGLGKTFIGLMLIERLIRDRKRVMLLVPKAARDAVWEPVLNHYLPHLYGDFSNLVVFSHTDLQRGGDFPTRFMRMKDMADAIVIDEAHPFRSPGPRGDTGDDLVELRPGQIRGEGRVRPSRYRQLYDIVEGPGGPKQLFMLTATPVNNKLADFRHMVELFTGHHGDYFSGIGIHAHNAHFAKMERELRKLSQPGSKPDGDTPTDLAEAERVLAGDPLFHAIVVQRSRAYVKASRLQTGHSVAIFPPREPPQVAEYSVKKTYDRLLEKSDEAFSKDKPLFALAMYYPLAYYKGTNEEIDPFDENRQKQVVSLIRVQFLKRLESSARSFERSCERLLVRLLAFVTRHSETVTEKNHLERWKRRHADKIAYIQEHHHELWGDEEDDEKQEDLVS